MKGDAEARYRDRVRRLLLKSVTPASIVQIINAQMTLALTGSTKAARCVLEYVVGKPAETIKVEGGGMKLYHISKEAEEAV
jgi:hypothetical protein